jgi:hypothetical protein
MEPDERTLLGLSFNENDSDPPSDGVVGLSQQIDEYSTVNNMTSAPRDIHILTQDSTNQQPFNLIKSIEDLPHMTQLPNDEHQSTDSTLRQHFEPLTTAKNMTLNFEPRPLQHVQFVHYQYKELSDTNIAATKVVKTKRYPPYCRHSDFYKNSSHEGKVKDRRIESIWPNRGPTVRPLQKTSTEGNC